MKRAAIIFLILFFTPSALAFQMHSRLDPRMDPEDSPTFVDLTLTGGNIVSGNPINLKPSGDLDDYWSFETIAGIPTMLPIGSNEITTKFPGSFIWNLYDNADVGMRFTWNGFSFVAGIESDKHLDLTTLNNGDIFLLPHGTGKIALKPSGDIDDFLQITTVDNVPTIEAIGGSLIDFVDNSLTTTGYISCKNFTDSAHYTGFPNRDDTSLSWDDGTYTLTLTATTDPIWIDGVEYNINTLTQTVTEVTSGLYWFWITAPGGTPQLNSSVTMPGFDTCWVATVYWNTITDLGLYSDERHWFGRDQWNHEYLHETVGARYALGLTLTLPTTTTDDDFQLESGEFYDEDIEHLIAQQTACTVLYHDGSVDWAWVQAQAFAYKTDDNTTTGDLQYNNVNALTNATANRYVNYWMFISGDEVDPTHIVIGSAQWTTLAGAESESLPSLGALPSAEEKLIYKLTYRATSPPSLIEVVDFRASSGLPGGGFIPSSHAALSNLVITESNHTSNPDTLWGADGDGVATEYTESNYYLVNGTRIITGDVTLTSTIPVITLNGQGGRVSTITGAEGSNHFIFFTNNGYEFFTNGNLQLSKGSVSANPWDFQDNRIITTGKMEAADIDIFAATPVLRMGKDTDEHFALTFSESERRSYLTHEDDADSNLAHYMRSAIDTPSTGDDIWEWTSDGVDRMVLNSSSGLNLQALDITTSGDITGGNLNVANWDTAYSHSQDNTQAHSDYMLNTGDTVTGSYTFVNAVVLEDGLEVTGTATFVNDIDVTDASYFDDALEVNGKLTVNGGTDPPYVLIDLQTKEQIVMRCRQEIPLSKAGGKAIVNIIGDERIKWFIPLTGEFYGEKLDESGWVVSTVIDTWDDGQVCYNPNSITRYRYDRITDTIESISKTIYSNSFPADKVLNRDTGEIEDLPVN